jgi:hypothetical protein
LSSPTDAAISGRLLLFLEFHHALSAAEKMLFAGERCGKGISLRDINFTHRVFDHLINIAGRITGRISKGSIFIVAEQIF